MLVLLSRSIIALILLKDVTNSDVLYYNQYKQMSMRSAAFQCIFQSELCWPKWSLYERSLIYDNPLRLDLCQFPYSLSTDLREWHVASAYKVEALLLPRG